MGTKNYHIDQFEYDSEASFSLSFMQNSVRPHIKSKHTNMFPNIRSLLQNPHIFVFRNSSEENMNEQFPFLITGNQIGRKKHQDTRPGKIPNFKTPFAIVFVLQLQRENGILNLSNADYALLEHYKELLRESTNVAYVVKASPTETELDNNLLRQLSANIDRLLCAKGCNNATFARLFFEHDSQLPIRIGLCINESALVLLKYIHECIKRKIKELHHKVVFVTEHNNNETEIKADFHHVRKQRKTKEKPIDREATFTNGVGGSYLTNRNDPKLYILQEAQKRMIKEKRNIYLTERYKNYKYELERRHNRRKLTLNNQLKEYKRLDEIVSNEINITNDNLELHEWKTVALRCDKVKGFGFGNKTVEIYLENQTNVELQRTDVIKYLQKYLNLTRFQYRICYKDPKLTLYTHLEQGSKILPANNSDSYGSLGLFFSDGKGQYFFSTCDHVIGKDKLAYSYLDKTKLGRNVFACHPNYMNNEKIDFSLVLLSPEKSVQVSLALKKSSSTDRVTKVEIFRGDISEIRNRWVYKWGATPPHFQKGRCVSFVSENECMFSLEINTEMFAKEGDSGSVICIDSGTGKCLVGFVIIGGNESDNSKHSTIAVYKAVDAINKVYEYNSYIKPCCLLDLENSEITIPGSMITTEHPPKRQRLEKVLEAGAKRLSPPRLSPQRSSPRRVISPRTSPRRRSPQKH